MDLQTSKLELVKLIININSQKTISKLLKVVKAEKEDFWYELTESEKQEIELGIKLLDSGQRIPFNEFLKKVK